MQAANIDITIAISLKERATWQPARPLPTRAAGSADPYRRQEAPEEAAHFFKILPSDVVTINDEIDLRPGKLRVKRGGGNAGYNGLRSIDACLGPDYWRVQIGVGHPGIKEFVQPYVLQNFPDEERTLWVEPLLAAIADTIPLLISGAGDAFMSEVARRFSPPNDDTIVSP